MHAQGEIITEMLEHMGGGGGGGGVARWLNKGKSNKGGPTPFYLILYTKKPKLV